jgi:hypothetical protein
MEAGTDGAVRAALRTAVERHAATCLLFDVDQGDRFHVVHHDGVELMKIGRRVAEDLAGVPGTPRLRLAAQRGEVFLRHDVGGRRHLDGGRAVLDVARILLRVPPGSMWVTEDLLRALEGRSHLFTVRPVRAELVDVRKTDDEAPLMHRVFEVT